MAMRSCKGRSGQTSSRLRKARRRTDGIAIISAPPTLPAMADNQHCGVGLKDRRTKLTYLAIGQCITAGVPKIQIARRAAMSTQGARTQAVDRITPVFCEHACWV